MNQTTNYNLNQWDAADPVRREDFNSDNAIIDAALGDHAGRIGTLEQQMAGLGNCRVATYSYVGKGTAANTIIPYREKPLFLLIVGGNGSVCAVNGNAETGVTLYLASSSSVRAIWADSQVELSGSVSLRMDMPDVQSHAISFWPLKT